MNYLTEMTMTDKDESRLTSMNKSLDLAQDLKNFSVCMRWQIWIMMECASAMINTDT